MKNRTGKKLVCDLCGKPGARLRHITETHGKGHNLLVIENIPMIDCPHCGELYFTAETLHEVDRLKRHPYQGRWFQFQQVTDPSIPSIREWLSTFVTEVEGMSTKQ